MKDQANADTGPRRIRPPESIDEVAEILVERGPFDSKQKLLMFAASLGVRDGERKPFEKTSTEIRWEIFQRNGDDSFIQALAVREAGGLAAFDDPGFDRGISAFEEYANFGLQFLKKKVVERPIETLDSLIALINVKEVPGDRNELEQLSTRELEVLGL